MFLKIKDKIFYGWVMVAASLVIGTTLFGGRFSFGVFFKSLESEFGLTRAATSGVYSTYLVSSAAFGVLGGWALDKYGPRVVVFLMGLLTGLSLLITSQAASLWQLFLSYSLLLSIGTGATYPVLMSIVSRWFGKRRGFALGIAGSAVGLSIIVMAPLAAYLISSFGWRMSYVVIGLIAWFIVISLSMLLRKDPSEIGTPPNGVKLTVRRTGITDKEENSQPTGLSLLQAIKTRSFWLISTVFLFFASSLHLVLTHVVPYTTDIGISAVDAAAVLGIIGGSYIPAALLSGRVSDIIGGKLPSIMFTLLQAGALVWLIWAQELWTFYLFAIAVGLSWGGINVASTRLIGDIFGRRNLGVIMGTTTMAFQIGAAIGPAIGGYTFDVTGGYTTAFAIGAAAMLVTNLLLAFTRRETNTEISQEKEGHFQRKVQR